MTGQLPLPTATFEAVFYPAVAIVLVLALALIVAEAVRKTRGGQ